MAADDVHVGAEIRPWAMPAFDGPPTAASIERVEQQAWQEGEARGYAEGLQRGAAEIARRVASLEALIGDLAAPLADQDERIAADLQRTAWTLGELLARSHLRHDPEAVARLVHEAIATLAAPAQSLVIQVAPAQHAALKQALEQQPPAQAWRLEPNATLPAGDCRVIGEHATADATLEARLRALSEQLLDTDTENGHAGSTG